MSDNWLWNWPKPPGPDLDPGHDAMPKDYRNLDPGHDKAGRGKAWEILEDYYNDPDAGRGEWANPPIIECADPDCGNFDINNYYRQVRYMAWCYDMHNLLTRLLDWIWKRIE